MSNKSSDPSFVLPNDLASEEAGKSSSGKHLSKFEYDLYHEEDDVAHPIIRVRHYDTPDNGERWRIFDNGKVAFIVEGSKLGKKERNYLKTPEGVIFLMNQYKEGISSFAALKKEINKKVKKLKKA